MYKMDDTEASLIIDDFTKEKSIQITKLAGDTSNLFVETFELNENVYYPNNLKKLDLQFAYNNGDFFLRLKGIINRSDTISFLFENNHAIEKRITSSVSLHRKEFAETVELSKDEMRLFATTFLKKWKITKDSNTFVVGGFGDYKNFTQYPTSEEGQYLLLVMARQLIKQIMYHYPNQYLDKPLI